MSLPYRARVNERVFLNLPGFHGGAYVVAYVEDTSERCLVRDHGCEEEACTRCPHNFEPRMILELADCSERIQLDFDVDSEAQRANSLHKIDTLLAALRVFRQGLVDEFEPYGANSTRCATSRAERRASHAWRPAPCLRSSVDKSTGLRTRAQRFNSSRRLPLDTVAERSGARLQPATRRFESARCLSNER